ncbi:DegT/DnrJ/EryC1/StrS family aminotransferase [Candidatus Woesearchaeota archaeon]|nr:DegT/DnrJ/EryC1/StrS family aminotransferase [Candidatus Woesearchaeota archaeon]
MIPIAKPDMTDVEVQAVAEVLKSGMLVQGKKVKELEEAFAKFIGTKYSIATSSGTTALHVALIAHGIGPGDEVLTSPFTFISTANSILFCGAKPVFVDIDPDTFNIDASKIQEKINSKTKAIIPVHLFGQSCDMDKITEIAEKYRLVVIEDACQSHGAEYKGKKTGSFGTGCFSFYPTKNMTAGEGGIITTNDEEIYNKACLLRDHGMPERYNHTILGYNYRMTDIHAAIGIKQLEKLEEYNKKRIENAQFLTENINIPGIITPKIQHKHVFNQYTIKITPECKFSRKELMQKLKNAGIGHFIYYPCVIYYQEPYADYAKDCPIAEKISKQVLSIPVHPKLSNEDLQKLKEFFQSI